MMKAVFIEIKCLLLYYIFIFFDGIDVIILLMSSTIIFVNFLKELEGNTPSPESQMLSTIDVEFMFASSNQTIELSLSSLIQEMFCLEIQSAKSKYI